MADLKKSDCRYCVEEDEQRANWILDVDISFDVEDGYLVFRNEELDVAVHIPIQYCPMCGRKL